MKKIISKLPGFPTAIILVIFFLFPLASFAQFHVFTWDNFESGTFPENLELLHTATPDTVYVFDYTTADAPGRFQNGIAATECGKYGLKFDIQKTKEYLKVASKYTLDRKTLGANGKALYQADFFLPKDLSELPYSIAVVAVLHSEDVKGAQFSFYRFGLVSGKDIFFSFTHNTPEPLLYKRMKIQDMNLKRPGWHRFQIIFDGQTNIICAVDGVATTFSPFPEPTLTQLRAGIMVSSSTTPSGECYADNLSIQWTTEKLEIPNSPWSPLPEGSSDNPVSPFTTIAGKTGLNWFASPEEAWQQCVSQKRPILILFEAPKVKSCQNFRQFLSSTPQTQELFKHFVLLRLDVNQLRGGTLYKQYGVFKVPCLGVMGTDGILKRKEYFRNPSDWDTISQNLQTALSP